MTSSGLQPTTIKTLPRGQAHLRLLVGLEGRLICRAPVLEERRLFGAPERSSSFSSIHLALLSALWHVNTGTILVHQAFCVGGPLHHRAGDDQVFG